MSDPQIVIDTNVMYSGLRSKRGYSFQLLQIVGTERFEINLSVPLVLEYEEVLLREEPDLAVGPEVIGDVIDFHCRVARRHRIFYLWRPFLPDADDEMVLELAVTAGASHIITYNKSDFEGVEDFDIRAIKPGAFLKEIGEAE
jgi:putative PIN family toxin of toxin-antitoxin system